MSTHNYINQARVLDANDPLQSYRQQFHLPDCHPEHTTVYFAGHSLGAQPKQAPALIEQELTDWARLGVLGHFDKETPWWSYHEDCLAPMAKVVGGLESEVAIMNSLTANLHFCFVSFYQPRGNKTKILMEHKAFPSDRYAIASQCRFHGYDPAQTIVTLPYSDDNYLMTTEAILETLEQHAHELALVFISAVHYLSGQRLDIEKIVQQAHAHDIKVGVDLAHAAGCAPLKCHDWQVDFAVWCNYKYLNAGPGAIGGAFIHENHIHQFDLPRFEGWWGHEKASRFDFVENFAPIASAESWQLSNPPIFQLAALKASLALFDQAGIDEIVNKTQAMGTYIQTRLQQQCPDSLQMMTPTAPEQRAGLLTFQCHDAKSLNQHLQMQGIIADTRQPNILRIAPNALYNTYQECEQFCQAVARTIL